MENCVYQTSVLESLVNARPVSPSGSFPGGKMSQSMVSLEVSAPMEIVIKDGSHRGGLSLMGNRPKGLSPKSRFPEVG